MLSGKAIEDDDLKSGDLLASEDWFILTVDRKDFLTFIFVFRIELEVCP